MGVIETKAKVKKAIEDRISNLGILRFSESQLQEWAELKEIQPWEFTQFILNNIQMGNISFENVKQSYWEAIMTPPYIWPEVMSYLDNNSSAIGKVSKSWEEAKEALQLSADADLYRLFNRMAANGYFAEYMPRQDGFTLTLEG